jgi:isocitrate/isopropylmalate dehydrogenase
VTNKITLLPGDGIGPKFAEAALQIINTTKISAVTSKDQYGALKYNQEWKQAIY